MSSIGTSALPRDHVLVGFVVTQPVPRPPAMAPFLPAELLTASSCIAEFALDDWCFCWDDTRPERRARVADALHVDVAALAGVAARCAMHFMDEWQSWPYLLSSEARTREVVALLPPACPWRVLALALHRDDVDGFLAEPGDGADKAIAGAERRRPLLPGLRPLGYELLGIDFGTPHSWLCNGLEKECAELLDVRPNEAGFLPTHAAARRALAHIRREEVGAEPCPWHAYLVLDATAHFPAPATPAP